ncbi:MAG: DnaJ domain-containing protein [Gammaproteobacteria bacterium]|nr:DnaJ domain-containing protein [Gammaproteobacteria bacterium]
MTKNPLIPDILSLLHQHPDGITEYMIIKSLDDHAGFSDINEDYQLAVFQKHFMVMNALYQLQRQLLEEERLYLDISPLHIQLVVTTNNSSCKSLSEVSNKKLSEYYLDWENFENTTLEDVEKLLEKFWTIYQSNDSRLSSLNILELNETADHAMIRQRYRELAAKHHPDKGGDPSEFIKIRRAYELLSSIK